VEVVVRAVCFPFPFSTENCFVARRVQRRSRCHLVSVGAHRYMRGWLADVHPMFSILPMYSPSTIIMSTNNKNKQIFFGLNLIFNGVMWALFTKALARGTSTTQVSILNTSSNFMITAVLGFLIFSESLPPLWFLGAAMLVAGNVIIGRREEGETKEGDEHDRAENGDGVGVFSAEEEGLLEGEEVELDGGLNGKNDDDVLDLGTGSEDEIPGRGRNER